MKDIELPPLPDPKYIWHDADEPGEAELFEFEFAGAVDGRCDICERLYTNEQMQAYASAAVEADRAQRVPDGWKLVPVEPTREMIIGALESPSIDWIGHYDLPQSIYRAMLSAAPAAPQPAGQMEPGIFAWATFDGEGGYDFRLYEDNETYRDDFIKRNGPQFTGWVTALYASHKEAAPAAQEPSADALDAKRYRFAADPQSDGYAVCEWFHDGWIPISTDDLDAAIAQKEGASK